ncbi:hypothetical protein WKW79_36720 [Variovorax robiniae]|uniref:DUF2946 domain-containing protein n=1 Tax=Variovorax robiniae TaxID=1836199 RepID=A0ABU8XLZ0_9BURK
MSTRLAMRLASGQRVIVLAMLLAFAFSQLSMVVHLSSFLGARSGAQHALMHWQGTPHHHHHDGSIGNDHSAESNQHVSLDGCLSAIAMQCDLLVDFGPHPLVPPASHDELAKPWPYLDGPMRPPSLPT